MSRAGTPPLGWKPTEPTAWLGGGPAEPATTEPNGDTCHVLKTPPREHGDLVQLACVCVGGVLDD